MKIIQKTYQAEKFAMFFGNCFSEAQEVDYEQSKIKAQDSRDPLSQHFSQHLQKWWFPKIGVTKCLV